jgi:hypothetical protein
MFLLPSAFAPSVAFMANAEGKGSGTLDTVPTRVDHPVSDRNGELACVPKASTT